MNKRDICFNRRFTRQRYDTRHNVLNVPFAIVHRVLLMRLSINGRPARIAVEVISTRRENLTVLA